ncbi:sugar phosphate isomerase/epimerase [Arundinibacter roseus]|uniref:Sugar phosphate isomerase/epimerase n=1 Tax=Arundinibacter roseus TaxID=2070510 RepID=A0A4R4KJ32_9BACT|nr:sugar phosphate isomerase/epimerase [Arundinibacter roseus]
MSRRSFIQHSAWGALALTLPKPSSLFQSSQMGIVVHSYASRWNSKTPSSTFPGFTNALDLMQHCHQIGAGGIQVVVRDWGDEFSKKVRSQREKWDMYLEGSISLPRTAEDVSRFEQDVKNAKEAGAQVLRTVCMNGRRYESLKTAQEFQEFKKNAIQSLQWAEPVVRKHKVKLAVENHKDWRATELAATMRQLDSPWVGVTLDFGNSIALLEKPMEVVQTLLPFLMSTHVKDMGVQEYDDGFLLSEVPLGEGILDLPAIVALCQKQNPTVTFNLEMITRDPLKIPCLQPEYWATMAEVSGAEAAAIIRMIREKKSKTDLPVLSDKTVEERLNIEEKNILESLNFSRKTLKLT